MAGLFLPQTPQSKLAACSTVLNCIAMASLSSSVSSSLPRISILMPVYNAAPFLAACLESILRQDYSNWELLAVDDHSTDNSKTILNQYSQKDARIRCLQNEQKGILPALDLAYRQATGALISRMDADDLMPSYKLTTLAQLLLHHGKGYVATGAVAYFSAAPLGNGYQKYSAWLNGLTKTGRNFEERYKECVIPSPCWLVYREDFDQCGAFSNGRYPEDYDLCFRFFEQGLRCIGSPLVLHFWRDSSGRASRNDPNYKNNSFLKLKLHYFLKLDWEASRPLVLWGAGKKGKQVAQLLKAAGCSFTWICNNPKKIGHQIYGQYLQATTTLEELISPQILLTVAQPDAKQEIQTQLENTDKQATKDYFWLV